MELYLTGGWQLGFSAMLLCCKPCETSIRYVTKIARRWQGSVCMAQHFTHAAQVNRLLYEGHANIVLDALERLKGQLLHYRSLQAHAAEFRLVSMCSAHS